MRKSIILVIYILLAGSFLLGCDFYAGYDICLAPNGSYKHAESNMALREDFDTVTRMVESFAVQQDFEEYVWERESLRRVYQNGDGKRLYRIYNMFYRDHDMIVISVLEMQTRKRSQVLEKMYIALRNELRAEFGDRIKCEERRK